MIIPSINLINGVAAEFIGRTEKQVESSKDAKQLFNCYKIVGEVTINDYNATFGKNSNQELIHEFLNIAPCRIAGGINTIDSAINW